MWHATRRGIIVSFAAITATSIDARTRVSAGTARIGWLTAQRESSLTPYLEAMRAGLADLGYIEGRNLIVEFRFGDDVTERVSILAKELVDLPVDLIVAQGAAAYEIANLQLPVPIVYCISADPVASGFAESLTQPHGNMTGLTFMAFEFAAKRLELLQEMVPGLKRVAVIGNPEHPGSQIERAYTEETGRRLSMKIDYLPTPTKSDLLQAFTAIANEPPGAISLLADGFAIQNRQSIMAFANAQRVPVISGWPVFAYSGALCTYGPRLTESYRRIAYYVDRILKGAKPSDLPIERPSKFELIVNLRTARALELTISRSMLARADEIIE